jgi:hypothetical protein
MDVDQACTSHHPSFRPRKDTERETQEAVVADAGNTEVDDRDLVHDEGGTLDLGEDRSERRRLGRHVARMDCVKRAKSDAGPG